MNFHSCSPAEHSALHYLNSPYFGENILTGLWMENNWNHFTSFRIKML